MGALTAKKIAFSYRTWENKTFQEIDETEVSLFRVRIEKLKNRRQRILPIKYWISDAKRYHPERQKSNTALIVYKLIGYYSIKAFDYIETYRLHYLGDAFKITASILLRYSWKRNLSIFLGRILSNKTFLRSPLSCNIYMYDIYNAITPHMDTQLIVYNKFKLTTSKVLLLINPRYISPAFTSFLYQTSDISTIESCSNFSSSFDKTTLPFSNFIINEINQGKYNLDDTTIVTSLSSLPIITKTITPIIKLYPLFLQSTIVYDTLPRYRNTSIDLNLSYGHKHNSEAFVSTLETLTTTDSSMYLSLTNHIFDRYLFTNIDLKFLTRLFLLYYTVIPGHLYNQNTVFIKYTPKKKSLINGLLSSFSKKTYIFKPTIFHAFSAKDSTSLKYTGLISEANILSEEKA